MKELKGMNANKDLIEFTRIGSSGEYARIGSSGEYAQIEIKGVKGVCAAIGTNSRIKGIKGTWITLAEYDKENNPLFVKSAQIDGIKIKENVWYELVEVKR